MATGSSPHNEQRFYRSRNLSASVRRYLVKEAHRLLFGWVLHAYPVCVAIKRLCLTHPTRLANGYPASHLMISACAFRVNAVSTHHTRVEVHTRNLPAGLSTRNALVFLRRWRMTSRLGCSGIAIRAGAPPFERVRPPLRCGWRYLVRYGLRYR